MNVTQTVAHRGNAVTAASSTGALAALEAFLVRGRNAEGGWAYHPGKAARLEPTCWALLALGARAADRPVLAQWPAADGMLLERRGGTPNYAFHALALLAMRALGAPPAGGVRPLLAALQAVKGDAIPDAAANRQDNSLQGWSWIGDTFSWVEPTAWALLALKHWARTPGITVDPARIDVAERLLVDRCCAGGGWNYGNANVLGQDLKAFVPTTAIALLALQDRRTLPAVLRSLDYLERAATLERSGVALSLALIALTAFGRAAAPVREALVAQVPTTIEFGNQMAAAMALYALGSQGSHGALVF